jgi:protease PrsW
MGSDSPVGRPGGGWPRWLTLALAIGVIGLCAIALVGFLGVTIGVDAFLIGLAASILPVPLLVLAFLWLGRYEPEPPLYLVLAFGWGAFVATLLAIVVNTASAFVFAYAGLPVELVAVVVAPVIEEIGKVAGPLLLLFLSRYAVTGITKGIVYCGVSAIGFAMVENILYIGGHGYRAGMDEFGPATGVQTAIMIFIVRILMSAFAHPLFTAAAGIGIGVAARSRSPWVRTIAILAGVAAAMVLHATWNLMAVVTGWTGQPLVFLYGYVALMVPLFLGAIGVAIWLRSSEGGKLTQRMLPDYVRAGWFSPPEVAALSTLGTRNSARRWARRVAGHDGVRAMRRFQFVATRLALLRDRVVRGLYARPADRIRTAAEERWLLAEVARNRDVFAGRDPQMPPAHWDGQQYDIVFPDGRTRSVAAPPEPVVPVPVLLPPPAPPPPGAYLPGPPPPAYLPGHPPSGAYPGPGPDFR